MIIVRNSEIGDKVFITNDDNRFAVICGVLFWDCNSCRVDFDRLGTVRIDDCYIAKNEGFTYIFDSWSDEDQLKEHFGLSCENLQQIFETKYND